MTTPGLTILLPVYDALHEHGYHIARMAIVGAIVATISAARCVTLGR
jgi:hypothetical protein